MEIVSPPPAAPIVGQHVEVGRSVVIGLRGIIEWHHEEITAGREIADGDFCQPCARAAQAVRPSISVSSPTNPFAGV
jgi:hypothetical protein